MERLQKVIAQAGIASRRKAEKLILEGKVKVNGVIIKELGTKVKDSDEIEINNELLEKEEKVYFLLNKPRQVITSTSDDKGRKTVIDLIPIDKRIYPVGRLDYDTTGALLLTNDGEFANIITHPKNGIEKVYLAKLKGIINVEAINKIKRGIKIDNTMVKPSRIKLKTIDKEKNTCLVEIIIHEGKNHEVKRIFDKVGFEVLKLTRKRIGPFTIKELKSGEYRKLTPKEVQIVYSLDKK